MTVKILDPENGEGVFPPQTNPLIPFDDALALFVVAGKLPNSSEFPKVAIVTNCIVFCESFIPVSPFPPNHTTRVGEAVAGCSLVAYKRSPKSDEFTPNHAIVMNSMLFAFEVAAGTP